MVSGGKLADAVLKVFDKFGPGYHPRSKIIEEALKLYVPVNGGVSPAASLSATLTHMSNENDSKNYPQLFNRRVGDDGKLEYCLRTDTDLQTEISKEIENTIDAELEEYALEADVTALLATKGYTIIEDERGNAQFMNPDAYRIINGIESVEVKNTLTPRNYAQAIAEAVTNGVFANTSVLIYVNGPDAEIKILAEALGVGVRKVVGKEIVDIVAPRRKEISAGVAKLYISNKGVASAFIDLMFKKE